MSQDFESNVEWTKEDIISHLECTFLELERIAELLYDPNRSGDRWAMYRIGVLKENLRLNLMDLIEKEK